MGRINTPRKTGGLGEMKIPLMADLNKSICRDYGVLKEDDGIAFRSDGLLMSPPTGSFISSPIVFCDFCFKTKHTLKEGAMNAALMCTAVTPVCLSQGSVCD